MTISSEWMVWFWVLLVFLIIALCVCMGSSVYNLCSSTEDNTSCISCYCCYCWRYNTLIIDEETRQITSTHLPRPAEVVAANTSRSNADSSPESPLSNNAQVSRAKRLMPRCKIIKFDTNTSTFLFRKEKKHKNDVCPICLEQYFVGESVILCPCRHAYHLSCLESWLKIKGVCPLCKLPIKNELSERAPLLYPS